jgi:hypothetical protein
MSHFQRLTDQKVCHHVGLSPFADSSETGRPTTRNHMTENHLHVINPDITTNSHTYSLYHMVTRNLY